MRAKLYIGVLYREASESIMGRIRTRWVGIISYKVRILVLSGITRRPLLAGCYPLGDTIPTLAGSWFIYHSSVVAVPRLFAFYALPPLVMCGSTILAFGHRNAPILSIFMRDGFFWFLSLVALRVAEIIIWNRGRVTLAEIPVVPGTAATAIISARVILNLKQMTSEPSHSVVSGETAVGTELEYRKYRCLVYQQYALLKQSERRASEKVAPRPPIEMMTMATAIAIPTIVAELHAAVNVFMWTTMRTLNRGLSVHARL
ncbi:hypothetical protein R3P38DRAFT_2763253 [Favolaschia claudopus]|uniref:Uncharacterized protein n=1 Tax=Favolaschia claudopus TaxID=2862362 RepID=A0AAW0DFT2_9AGAR